MLRRIDARWLPSWLGLVGLVTAVGIACFLAARFSLSLLPEPNLAVELLAVSASAFILAALFRKRQSYEAALKDRNEQLQLALDGAELGVWNVDLATGRLESDARDRKINAHNPHALPKTLTEARALIHPDDLLSLDNLFTASAQTGRSYKAEYRLAAAAGRQERWVEVDGIVVRGAAGRAVRLLGITRDITARKFAERKLKESERKFRDLLGALPTAVYVTDPVGHITYYNAAASELWGVKPELGTSEFCGSWKLYWPDGTPLPHHECPMAMALREKRPIRGVEAVAERPDGTRVPFLPFPTPLFDGSGVLTGGINLLVDISERKRAEERQCALNAELDHRVKNVLATVAAIISQAPKDGSLADFVTSLDGRIKSLSRTHELLSRRHWSNISLAEIAQRELEPYAGGNTDIGGPLVAMQPEAAQAVAMVLHELATNAAKHGVFSQRRGRVLLRWWWQRNGSHDRLAIEWKEVGGPPVLATSRPSYGTAIIRELIPFELGGAANLTFSSEGITCRLEIPSKWVSPDSQLSDDARELLSA
jgi:PAS domain S-box-containing protein